MLWGVHMVNTGFNRAFGAGLRKFIATSTKNRFLGFLSGIVVAALLQSSTAACLIVSSFAARGIISIMSGVAVMLGADVGTTLAAQLLSFDMKWMIPVLITSGYIVNKTMAGGQYKHVGRALIGLGLVMVSLKMIVAVSQPLKESEALHVLIGPLSEPTLAILVGACLTWLVHSSLGMVLLYASFVASGTLPIGIGITLVLGANLGGAIAPVIMTLRESPHGRRVPLGNLLMRGIGVLMIWPLLSEVEGMLDLMSSDPERHIVNFHTAFNLFLAVVFLPLIGLMTRMSEKILPDRPREEDERLPRYLDSTALASPPAALACAARETLRISDIIQRMLRDTLEAFRSNNEQLVQKIREQDNIVDTLYGAVKMYMTRLSGEQLDIEEGKRYMQILTFSTNLEHIGDTIDKNLMEMATKKMRAHDSFSKQGFAEIAAVHAQVMENFQLAQNVFMTGDVNMARKLFEGKAGLRDQELAASKSHFERLREGVAESVATSSIHLDVLRDLRRINSYLSLIVYPILESAGELEPTRLKKKGSSAAKGGALLAGTPGDQAPAEKP